MTDLFQCHTYSRVVFMEFKLTGDAARAAMIAWPQLIFTLVAFAAAAFAMQRWHWDLDASSLTTERRSPPPVSLSVAIIGGAILALAVPVPFASLLVNGLSLTAWRNLSATVLAEQIVNSLQPALLAATTSTLAASMLGLAAERLLRPLRLAFYSGALSALVAPPTLYAIGVSALASKDKWVNWLPDTQLPTAFANAARWMPLAVLMIASALRLADRAIEDAARIEGDSDIRAPLRVTLQPAAMLVLGGWMFVFAFTLGDVAMASLLYPPGGETLAVAIFDAMHYAHEPEVAALCLCLLALVVTPAAVAVAFFRQRRSR